jgi:hypothetical protein
MIITQACLDYWKTARGGFTRAQLNILGLDWPPLPNWKETILGKEIDEALFQEVYDAKFLLSKRTLEKRTGKKKDFSQRAKEVVDHATGEIHQVYDTTED